MRFKRKTSKSAKKRYKISGTGKVSRRNVGLNHFNAKDTGRERRQRRTTKRLTKNDGRNLHELLPYNPNSF
ncbi:MAG: 50S ribosomal protein L35 [Minisyncoccia bacterium]|jgi:large subunit ribosomal protein L35